MRVARTQRWQTRRACASSSSTSSSPGARRRRRRRGMPRPWMTCKVPFKRETIKMFTSDIRIVYKIINQISCNDTIYRDGNLIYMLLNCSSLGELFCGIFCRKSAFCRLRPRVRIARRVRGRVRAPRRPRTGAYVSSSCRSRSRAARRRRRSRTARRLPCADAERQLWRPRRCRSRVCARRRDLATERRRGRR